MNEAQKHNKFGDRRANVLTIRFTSEQFERIATAARLEGKSIHASARDVLMEAARRETADA